METGDAYVEHLSLRDVRCFAAVDLDLTPGVTVLVGPNGAGKTSLLEAVAWVARVGYVTQVAWVG